MDEHFAKQITRCKFANMETLNKQQIEEQSQTAEEQRLQLEQLLEEKKAVRWYVMRAYKCEAKAESLLSNIPGLEFYMPKREVLRTYHGKKQVVKVPVIASLFFVHGRRLDIQPVKESYPFIQYAMTGRGDDRKFMTVPDKQMEDFIRVAESDGAKRFLMPDDIDLTKGTRVRIASGALIGLTGTFIRVKGNRKRTVVVMLDNLLGVSVEISSDIIERI